MEKKWIIAEKTSEDLLTQLLLNRGIDDAAEQQEFLQPTSPDILISQYPRLLGVSLEEIERAVDLIREAIRQGRPVVIHGDYDVDGLCSTAILWETLYFGLGYKNVHPFIPDRFTDGYGLSTTSLQRLFRQFNNGTMKQSLLITVDCGITAAKEVADAQALGMDVVIVDHHSRPAVLPNAQGLVWSDKVCAAGLAWLLGYQILPEMSPSQLDLVALATLADLQPLLGVNRSLVKFGLAVLNRTPHLGLKILSEAVGLVGRKIDTYEVGWIISPRLNAAGRLESALDSLRLLCTRDRAQAYEIAIKLNKLNTERQQRTVEAAIHAKESYLTSEQYSKEARKIILVHHESYHEGVIGLVAGKLAQEFGRPALVLSKGETYSKGSARSVPGFDIVAALQKLTHLFEDLGGHPMAAGFTVRNENLSILERELAKLAAGELDGNLLQPVLKIEAEMPLALLNREALASLGRLAPHGLGNPEPIFLTRRVQITAAQTVGVEGKHLKLRLGDSEASRVALWFGEGEKLSSFPPGALVDLVYAPKEDRWDGEAAVMLNVKDMRLSSSFAS